jgi:elongation factor P
MLIASQMRPGMAIRFESNNYKVISCEHHGGQGKMGGVVHARLKNLSSGSLWEHSFRSELKLELIPVEKQSLEFLYADAERSYFMDPVSFDQIGIDDAIIGPGSRFLQPGMQLPIEFLDGQPISVIFPDIMEMRVADTAPGMHQQQDNNWKKARLENGVELLVPQFVKSGDTIRIEISTLRYVDRAKTAK